MLEYGPEKDVNVFKKVLGVEPKRWDVPKKSVLKVDYSSTDLFVLDKNSNYCTYFVQSHDKHVKIGICDLTSASGVQSRLKTLQSSNPHQLCLRRLIQGNKELERYYHWKFYDYYIHGEWFDLKGKLVEFLEKPDLDISEISEFVKDSFNHEQSEDAVKSSPPTAKSRGEQIKGE